MHERFTLTGLSHSRPFTFFLDNAIKLCVATMQLSWIFLIYFPAYKQAECHKNLAVVVTITILDPKL